MTAWDRWYVAHDVEEALEILSSAPSETLPIAGGTDLLLDLQQGRRAPVHGLVDITRIGELSVMEQRGQELFVGAAVPLSRVVASKLVRYHAEALVQACLQIGGPQVRSVATLGGNVCHALPAADGAIALAAFDAQAEIASRGERRRLGLMDLYLGPGRSALDAGHDLLVGFYLHVREEGQGSAFGRITRPQGVALAVLNCGVWLERQAGKLAKVKVVVGPSGPIPKRAQEVEEMLLGRAISPATLIGLKEALRCSVRFRSSPYRASAEYRQSLAEILIAQVLMKAWESTEIQLGERA